MSRKGLVSRKGVVYRKGVVSRLHVDTLCHVYAGCKYAGCKTVNRVSLVVRSAWTFGQVTNERHYRLINL